MDGRDGARLQSRVHARLYDADAVRRVPGGIASQSLAPLLPRAPLLPVIVAPMSAPAPTSEAPHGVFEQRLTVAPADIDINGHVNNLRYLEWCLAAAVGHSESVGWDYARYVQLGAMWIVRSHTIEYLRPAFDGDELVVRTWVAAMSKVSSRRKSQVVRDDGTVLARGETLWVFVSRKAHALGRVPPELAAAFPVVPDP